MNNTTEKFEIDGKIYIYHKGKYYDENYYTLPSNELNKIISIRLQNSDFLNLPEKELLEVIKSTKEDGLYFVAKRAAELGLEKYEKNSEFVRIALPIFSSCCRKLNKPHEAITKSKKYLNRNTSSPAIHTSLAAAYCDIGDYFNAKRYADMAYARLANLDYEFKREITNVYERIKKEAGLK